LQSLGELLQERGLDGLGKGDVAGHHAANGTVGDGELCGEGSDWVDVSGRVTYLLVGNVDPLRDLSGLLGIRGDELATGDSGDYKGGRGQFVLDERTAHALLEMPITSETNVFAQKYDGTTRRKNHRQTQCPWARIKTGITKDSSLEEVCFDVEYFGGWMGQCGKRKSDAYRVQQWQQPR
jgi:hypothetical protein